MKKVLIALEILIIVLLGGFVLAIYSGWYNVAASLSTNGFEEWVLETAMENSVRRHARDVAVPELARFDPLEGLRHFDGMCVLCHGAPGVEPSEIGKGITPEPPELPKAVRRWTPGELFWIVKHGIRMTGMPGFGPTHSDEELWAIVAFLRRLPEMSPEEYRSLVRQLPGREPVEKPGRQNGPGHQHGPGDQHGPGGKGAGGEGAEEPAIAMGKGKPS